ncbi:hypothetical protein GGR58DRAFT_481685 [Xylaria digitata]|nr:hypothetical protein GGR58DRAFT_481685 [Xylaria digitata]
MEDDDRDYRYDCHMNVDAPGFPSPPRSPKPAKSGAFSFDDKNGLRVGDFSRAPLEDLRLLFRKNASSARRRAATKPWIIAQLHLYGIAFDKSAKVDELRSTLETAVKGQKCIEGGPRSVAAVREQLATQFAQNRAGYARAVEKHKLDVDQWHKQNFSKLKGPSDEARYDLNSFVSKYFLDDQGSPSPNKTPEPLIVWNLYDQTESLRSRVDAIPGLKTRTTGFLTVIAWAPKFKKGVASAFGMIDSRPDIKYDRPTLEALFDPDHFLAKYFFDGLHGKPIYGKQKNPLVLMADVAYSHEFEKLSRAAKHVPELLVQQTSKPLEEENNWGGYSKPCVIVGWTKQVIPLVESWKSKIAQLKVLSAKREERNKEKDILAKLKPHIDYARAHNPPASGPFTIDQLVGSYIMHCRLLQDDYGAELGSMTLDVHAPTSTHGAVAAFNFGLVEGTMLLASSEESLELLREEQAARSSDEEELTDSEYFAASGKRKAKASQKTSSKNFKRRLGGGRSHNHNRFYLQWAGTEPGTGKLVLDEDHERTGSFDLDKSGMTARGQFHYRAFFGDKPLVFTLLKVADKPRKQPDAWLSYREDARWIRW